MEERYEIRGKIGQGGLGAVYRGYDTRMSREVAIKRIQTTAGDPQLQEESTRQLIKEAGALGSLQHPHIVTIYDVGTDEEGPYVVMELISGKTLDELIEHAPLTWPDFREMAMQTQEALIAAQELDLIHSDIKPSNLMLTWLPSGKFQMKIVDFGLATLTHNQSKEYLEELEAVFGSIFFMAPEQFERVPLDARTDMYAMGCVYYQALTGLYPFDGQTGNEVMNAHLQHQVTPIQNIRADIPIWACDWIMWHINRMPSDRPESARQSLQVFLQNDKTANPPLSTGMPPAPKAAARSGPQPIRRPSSPAIRLQQDPNRGTAGNPAQVQAVALPTTSLSSGPAKTKSAPQPLKPPEGSKPSVHTEAHPIPDPGATTSSAAALATPTATRSATRTQQSNPTVAIKRPTKKGMSKGLKITLASTAALMVAVGGWAATKMGGRGVDGASALSSLITAASDEKITELPMDRAQLDLLLSAAAGDTPASQRPALYRAIAFSKATEKSEDFDSVLVNFTLQSPELSSDVREAMMREVLRRRKNPEHVPALISFARSTKEDKLAAAALAAIRYTAREEDLAYLLEIVRSSQSEEIRKAAEETLGEIIGKSSHPTAFTSQILGMYRSASSDGTRYSLLRILARCGGDEALEIATETLTKPDPKAKTAAITALGLWGNEAAFPTLMNFISSTTDAPLRSKAFESAYRFASEPTKSRKSDVSQKIWTTLAAQAKWPEEQKRLITGLADYGSEAWAYQLISGFATNPSGDPAVKKLAEETVGKIRR